MSNVPSEQIFPAHWTSLSHEIREHLAKVFSINRSVATEIVDNKIISDGRGVNDLKAITKEKMQEYLNNSKEEGFFRLWELVVSKARFETQIPTEIKLVTATPVVETSQEKPKKTGLEPASEGQAKIANILLSKENAHVKPKRATQK